MHTRRLHERVRWATPAGIGKLSGHALRWDKRSRDGSGKCDAEATGRDSDVVWGVLFEIDVSTKPDLDRAVGLGRGYAEKEVDVATSGGVVKSTLYYATDKDSSLRPYDWYKTVVIAGAREHGLPQDYVLGLEAALSVADPDAKRAAANEKLLSAGTTREQAIEAAYGRTVSRTQ